MRWALRTKRSAGIRVQRRVYRAITEGNHARNVGKLDEAIAHYRLALELHPSLAHIEVQLGHVLKEIGKWDDADAAYARATELRPRHLDGLLQRALLAERRGRRAWAVKALIEILRFRHDHDEAWRELARLVPPVGAVTPRELAIILTAVDEKDAAFHAAAETDADPAGNRPVVFDITDLVRHMQSERLPNGIQRFQIEVLTAAVAGEGAPRISVCSFVDQSEGWVEIPLFMCREMVRLSAAEGDADDTAWRILRVRLFLGLACGGRYEFPRRAILINLGLTIGAQDYFRCIRNAKAERHISYIPLIFDMIAIVRPEYCLPGWIRDFTTWVIGLFHHADAYLAISQSAKSDLMTVAQSLGHTLPDTRVEVIPLSADFRRGVAALPAADLARWGLQRNFFALFVSTIEPRKNHAVALDAWAVLLRRLPAGLVPRLVCVGRDGWMNDAVFDHLDSDPILADGVTLIHQASDTELELLYRECRFTLFPSLYEGWGLPVTESLCFGKVPIVADNSSLPEAGAGLALLFADDSLPALIAAVEKVAFDDAWRSTREKEISERFAPRAWSAIAAQIENAAHRLPSPADPQPMVPEADLGLYYPIGPYDGLSLWPGLVDGEIFRIGQGWYPPDRNGARIKSIGGTLQMRIHADLAAFRIYLHLRGPENDCEVMAIANGHPIGERTLRRGKTAWMALDVATGPGSILAITIRASVSDGVQGLDRSAGGEITVLGFFICGRDDEDRNAAFVRSRRTRLDELSAYRSPADTVRVTTEMENKYQGRLVFTSSCKTDMDV